MLIRLGRRGLWAGERDILQVSIWLGVVCVHVYRDAVLLGKNWHPQSFILGEYYFQVLSSW